MRRNVFAASAALLVSVLTLTACSSSIGSDPTGNQSEGGSQSVDPAPEDTGDPVVLSDSEAYWESLTLREQAASVLMLNYPGSDAAAIGAFLEEVQPGGIILMGDGVPAQENDLAAATTLWQSKSELPFLIAIDQEGGVVTRVHGDLAPGPEQLRDGDTETVRQAFVDRGTYLESLGINTNCGVIAD